MPKNIKEIILHEDSRNEQYSGTPPVKIVFNFPCTWTILHAEDLKQIIRKWIQGEKKKLNGQYQDALHLQLLIKDAFKEEGIDFK